MFPIPPEGYEFAGVQLTSQTLTTGFLSALALPLLVILKRILFAAARGSAALVRRARQSVPTDPATLTPEAQSLLTTMGVLDLVSWAYSDGKSPKEVTAKAKNFAAYDNTRPEFLVAVTRGWFGYGSRKAAVTVAGRDETARLPRKDRKVVTRAAIALVDYLDAATRKVRLGLAPNDAGLNTKAVVDPNARVLYVPEGANMDRWKKVGQVAYKFPADGVATQATSKELSALAVQLAAEAGVTGSLVGKLVVFADPSVPASANMLSVGAPKAFYVQVTG